MQPVELPSDEPLPDEIIHVFALRDLRPRTSRRPRLRSPPRLAGVGTLTDHRMRRSTAVAQVADLVELADDIHRRTSQFLDVRLTELWVGGAILEDVERMDTYDVVLVLDAPAEEVTWLAQHAGGAFLADQLRLTKNLVRWYLRSNEHTVHNHELRELVRVWTEEGPDAALLDRLHRSQLTSEDISQPPDDATLASQLEVELAQCRQHLATVLDGYHDHDWRRAHKGNGIYPEDHLWCAAQAVREISDAVAELLGDPPRASGSRRRTPDDVIRQSTLRNDRARARRKRR